MSEEIPAAVPSDATRKQLESDAGPHATPDQQRAAEKRKESLASLEGRSTAPEERHTRDAETVADQPRKKAARKRAAKKA